MGQIATEQEAATIGGGSSTSKQLVTNAKAQQLGCQVNGDYEENQCVQLEDLSQNVILIEPEVVANGNHYTNIGQMIVLPADKYFTFQALPNVGFEGTVHLEYSVSGGHGASIDVPFGYSGSLMSGRQNGYGSATLKILTPGNAMFDRNGGVKQVTFALAFN